MAKFLITKPDSAVTHDEIIMWQSNERGIAGTYGTAEDVAKSYDTGGVNQYILGGGQTRYVYELVGVIEKVTPKPQPYKAITFTKEGTTR